MAPTGILKCISAERDHVRTGLLFTVWEFLPQPDVQYPGSIFNIVWDILLAVYRVKFKPLSGFLIC